jgi:galactokinase
VAFVEIESVKAFATSVSSAYHSATGAQPDIRAVEAAAGAGVIFP